MPSTQLLESSHAGIPPLRNEPVQARSTARLAGLLDAAAAVVDEIGFERLTTAMVADRAGASIGTVYRYFPDRLAILQALGARNLDRALVKVLEEASNDAHDTWADALDAALGRLVDDFRSEPGFRALRLGDVIDIRPAVTEHTNNSVLADSLFDALAERFDLTDTPEARFAFETSIEVSDALAARAFARDADGDQKFLEAGRSAVRSLIGPHFDDAR